MTMMMMMMMMMMIKVMTMKISVKCFTLKVYYPSYLAQVLTMMNTRLITTEFKNVQNQSSGPGD